jgi:hypothetical protein
MVKTKAPLLLCLVALLAGCTASLQPFSPPKEILAIPAGAPGRFLSLALAGDSLLAVFCDAGSTALEMLRVPVGPHLPATAPPPTVIDRIDTAPPLSPSFGAHVLAVSDTALSVLYLARQNEEKSVLKLATRSFDAGQWNLDVVEPPGDPVAILPGDKGALTLFWAAGSLLTRSSPDRAPAQTLRGGFQLVDQAHVYAPTGFTAYDGATHSLLDVHRDGDGFGTRVIAGAGPVHSSLLLPDGRLALLTWDAAARRLYLLEQKKGASDFSRETVTLCDETGTVALLPVVGRTSYLFLFDEARRSGTGGPQHVLSLIAPGLGALGSRYGKTTLIAGPENIEGFAAVQAPGSLYVLVLQGGLKLLRVGLPQY